jgi:hypothetical protein
VGASVRHSRRLGGEVQWEEGLAVALGGSESVTSTAAAATIPIKPMAQASEALIR